MKTFLDKLLLETNSFFETAVFALVVSAIELIVIARMGSYSAVLASRLDGFKILGFVLRAFSIFEIVLKKHTFFFETNNLFVIIEEGFPLFRFFFKSGEADVR